MWVDFTGYPSNQFSGCRLNRWLSLGNFGRFDFQNAKTDKYKKYCNFFFQGGYFLNQNNQDLTPDLDNEERKKLGLVYYKPIAKELVDYLQTTGNRAEEKNDSKDEGMDQFEKIKSEIQNELKELDVIGELPKSFNN